MCKFVISLVLFSVCCCNAKPAFRAEKNFPSIGLRFRTLGNGAEPEPLPQPKTFTFRFTRGDESFTRNLFDPHELWMATQHLGQWRDRNDNVLIIGRATASEPELTPVTDRYVEREQFDEAMKSEEDRKIAVDDSAALRKWLARFTQQEIGEPLALKRVPFKIYRAYRFPLPERSQLLYAVSLKSRRNDGTQAPSDWYCFWIKIGDGTSLEVVSKDFEARFLTSLTPLSRGDIRSGKRNSRQPKAFSLGMKAPPNIKQSPQREAIKRSIANMPDWWYAETQDYIFLSNIRSSFGKKLIRSLQTSMESSQKAFTKLLPPFKPDEEVHVVRLFEDQEEYKRHVGDDVEWSNGVWSPARRELTILVHDKEVENTLRTIRHESFHQYLFYAGAMYPQSMWFNEGHACFCEGMTFSRGRVLFNETDRVAQIEKELDAVTRNLPNVIAAGRNEFYCKSQKKLLLNYTTAWALIYFLRKGLPTYKGYKMYERVLPTYWSSMRETHDCQKATDEAFAGFEMKRLQADFSNFWQRRRGPAKRVDPLQ